VFRLPSTMLLYQSCPSTIVVVERSLARWLTLCRKVSWRLELEALRFEL